jgi:hypothetical protein
MPQPPPGLQRPGIVGAGNVLDPEVRAEIREQLHPAVHDAGRRAAGGQDRQAEAPAAKAEEGAAQPAPAAAPAAGFHAGPYPHGDVDLSSFAANVPPGPVRPRRGRTGRRFYFLPDAPVHRAEENPPPAPVAPPGPKPG